MKSKEISKKTLINKLLEKHPETAEIMMAYGLHCIGCQFSEFDTLEDGARVHGMLDEEIAMMLKDVNKTIKNGKQRKKTKNRP